MEIPAKNGREKQFFLVVTRNNRNVSKAQVL